MTVDEAGRRAGAELRARFDGLTAPATDLTVGPSRPRRWRGALVGIAAVLIVAIVVAFVAGSRDPEPARGGPGGTWRRFKAPNDMTTIVATDDGFVGVGSVPREFRTKVAPAVWTSDDAEHWDRVRDAQFPSGEFFGFLSAARRGGVIVASTQNNDLWRSTDARTWRRVARLDAPGVDLTYMSTRPRGFTAIVTKPTSAPQSTVWTSADGRRWKRVEDRGTANDPVGVFGGARLGSRWISIAGAPVGSAPPVFESADRIRWSTIPGASAPERLNGPFVSNHRHTRVLAIQYEHTETPGSFGGRLWSTRDGKTWSEITSFHEQMPVANPDHIAQLGRWWVLGGNTGTPDGMRRASMWSSPDLRHWYEMPSSLRGRKTGVGMLLLTADGRVVGKGGHHVWVWTPPD